MPFLFRPKVTYDEFFDIAFKETNLFRAFEEKFQFSTSKGIDRINGYQFSESAKAHFHTAAGKIKAGTYRFSPYVERLRLKGRNKEPRIIGIPTIRDRVVINQLKECLAFAFPECVPKNIANSYIRQLAEELPTLDPSVTYVCGCDIKRFYDSIDRGRLLSLIASRIKHEPTKILVHRCLATPIIPLGTRKSKYAEYSSVQGVPQGLSISNLLAAIYLGEVDEQMAKLPVTYMRYVDDVFIYGPEQNVKTAFESLRRSMAARSLEIHALGSGKTYMSQVTGSFGYLGYWFDNLKITVREGSVERLLQSIAAQFSEYAHNHKRRARRYKYLTADRLKEIFVMELNERITGAVCEAKRYGWVAYYSQINDLSLLHRLDATVRGMFARLPQFGRVAPCNLKRFARAHFEMKFRPSGGYIRDYDRITTRAEKLAFLNERGRIDPSVPLTDDQINREYEQYVRRVLAKMQADEGTMY